MVLWIQGSPSGRGYSPFPNKVMVQKYKSSVPHLLYLVTTKNNCIETRSEGGLYQYENHIVIFCDVFCPSVDLSQTIALAFPSHICSSWLLQKPTCTLSTPLHTHIPVTYAVMATSKTFISNISVCTVCFFVYNNTSLQFLYLLYYEHSSYCFSVGPW